MQANSYGYGLCRIAFTSLSSFSRYKSWSGLRWKRPLSAGAGDRVSSTPAFHFRTKHLWTKHRAGPFS